MALALIGLAQNSNGNVFSNEHLYHLADIPIPHFQIQQQQQSPPPVEVSASPLPSLVEISVPPVVVSSTPPPVPAPVYQQEDFADFTSFDEIVQSNNNNNNPNDSVDALLDFDENHLNPPFNIKATSSETQSLASLDLPMPTINPSIQDDTSQKEISDNISFTSSSNNEIQPVTDTQSLHSINLSEPSKLGNNTF